MDIKEELRNRLVADKITTLITTVIWVLIIGYIICSNIVSGIICLKKSDWIIIVVGILCIAYELFRFFSYRKKLKELE